MKSIPFIIISAAIALIFTTCKKPARDNPWDELATLDPNEWAPKNLQIEAPTITQRTISWYYNGDNRIQGFKIDRKRGNENWVTPYNILSSNLRALSDTITINPTLEYQYRIYAYAGKNNSSAAVTLLPAKIPAPQNLSLSMNSLTSVTLNWSYNLTGHEGFKVERKTDIGSWEILVQNLNPELNSFMDDGLELWQHNYTYRIVAFLNDSYSNAVEILINKIQIGDLFAGGIVFYLDGNGGGLVCAESEHSSAAHWGCYESVIGSTGTGIGKGAANTAAILAVCNEANIAARRCNDLVLNGYSDWFLPSKDELNLMYHNLKLAGIGGFADDGYWSSSEYNSNFAWGQYFTNGLQHEGNKNDYYLEVRAVRAF